LLRDVPDSTSAATQIWERRIHRLDDIVDRDPDAITLVAERPCALNQQI
jgi:hypothetical protein